MVINALSVDVEEWYQTILFSQLSCDRQVPTDLPIKIGQLLSLFETYRAKATFFIVGEVAEKYPSLISKIAGHGHEIASHGYRHHLVYNMPRNDFYNDVRRSLGVLRTLSRQRVDGYRAPTWSIRYNMQWAIDVLKDLGLKYDSSIYPVSASLLRNCSMPIFPYNISEGFIEFPPSTFRLMGYNLPFAGGMFLRLFPIGFILSRIARINKKKHPVLVYLHPWDLNGSPIPSEMGKLKAFIQYANAGSVVSKLEILLRELKFSSVEEILKLA